MGGGSARVSNRDDESLVIVGSLSLSGDLLLFALDSRSSAEANANLSGVKEVAASESKPRAAEEGIDNFMVMNESRMVCSDARTLDLIRFDSIYSIRRIK